MSREKPHIRAVPWTTPLEDRVRGALGEAPAYVRRAARMERAVEDLFRDARREREEMLGFVCLRLRRVLDALTEETGRDLPDETLAALTAILEEVERLEAFTRLPSVPGAGTRRSLAAAIERLGDSVHIFNAKWRRWVREDAPLAAVNREIEGYNRHYPIERQCALRYVPLDRVTFTKRKLLTEADVFERFATLPPP